MGEFKMLRAFLLALLAVAAPVWAKADRRAALDELLAADRAFSAAAARAADPVAGLALMFDGEVVMPAPGKGHAVGRDAVLAVFRESPSYGDGSVRWAPVRGGISADGTQGFTYGLLSVTGGDAAKRNRKYLAYWVKRPAGWRVVAYRQVVREAGDVSTAMLPPSLPPFAVEPVDDPAVIAAHNQSVAAAEKAFSDRAQVVGVRQAFREFGREDAMNMYSGAGFAVGLDAVVANFKEEGPARIHWATERGFAASSGDLGVSIGTIWSNDARDGQGFPFFTAWRRDGPDQPWRYIAE
jgi:ketosteroid isomerase-like protein